MTQSLSELKTLFEARDVMDQKIPVKSVEELVVPYDSDILPRVILANESTPAQFQTTWSTDQFLNKIGFRPPAFFHNMRGHLDDAELVHKVVNKYLEVYKKDHPKKRWLLRRAQPSPGMGYQVRAVCSKNYTIVNNQDIVQVAINELGGYEHEVKQVYYDPDRTYINVVLPKFNTEVKVGDVVQLGFSLSNSEVGSGSVFCNTFSYRLVCENGMVVPHERSIALKRRHYGKTSKEILNDLRSSIRFIMGRFGTVSDLMKKSTTIVLEDPVKEIEALVGKHGLSKKIMSLVVEAYETEDLGGSVWHVSNSFTRVASVLDDNTERDYYLQRNKLMEIGGVILTQTPMTRVKQSE